MKPVRHLTFCRLASQMEAGGPNLPSDIRVMRVVAMILLSYPALWGRFERIRPFCNQSSLGLRQEKHGSHCPRLLHTQSFCSTRLTWEEVPPPVPTLCQGSKIYTYFPLWTQKSQCLTEPGCCPLKKVDFACVFWGKKKASQSPRVTQLHNPKGYPLLISQPHLGLALGMVK